MKSDLLIKSKARTAAKKIVDKTFIRSFFPYEKEEEYAELLKELIVDEIISVCKAVEQNLEEYMTK